MSNMVSRRHVLTAMAALPVVALTTEEAISAPKVPAVVEVAEPAPMLALAQQLRENVRGCGYSGDVEPYVRISDAFCRAVDVPDGVTVAAYPGAPVGLFTHPKTGETVAIPSRTRKLKVDWYSSSPEVLDDTKALVGIDLEAMVVDIVSRQMADIIEAEMREAVAAHGPSLFAFYIALMPAPTIMDPKDFSIRRSSPMMRYASLY